jgi:hypothetical protein
MSERSIDLKIRINFPTILIVVLLLHALFLSWEKLNPLNKKIVAETPQERLPLKVREIRQVGSRESKIKDSIYNSKSKTQTKTVAKDNQGLKVPKTSNISSPEKSLSLSDLAAQIPKRPGTRPEVQTQNSKAINAISLKGAEIKRFATGSNAASLSGDPRAATLSNSDILVNLEVPEGVNPDELNKYELMFYGFQRRTAINYINSFYKNLDKFQRANPHLRFPMTETKQIMTGRLTYDEKGNIKQIKMIRWSNIDKLQDFFVDVLKDMDTLHNPPQALWEKTGEFSIFFSLVVNG